MSYLRKQMHYLKFDKRLLEINMKSGTITADEYKTHLTQLEDMESQSETINLDGEKAAEDVIEAEEAPVASAPEAVTTPVNPAHSDPFGSGY